LLRRFLLLALAAPAPALPAPQTGAPNDYSGEAWIVEAQRRRLRFENDGTGREEWSGRFRVQSEAGIRQLGQVVGSYVSAFERLEFRNVRVIKPDGSVRQVPSDGAMELTSAVANAFPVYSDLRQKHLAVPDLRVGDVLEAEWIRTVHTPLAPGQFWVADSFYRTAVALDQTLEIDVPSGRPLQLKTAEGVTPSIAERDGRRVYVFRHAMKDLAAIQRERKLAERRHEWPAPDVALSSFRSWEELGAWYLALERERRTQTPEIRAKASELTRGLRTDQEKVQALYDYVATKVRYVAISFGQGAVQPRPAAETLSNGYGDCKDKHTLLAALLGAVGIQSHAALISNLRDADAEIPYLQFDHVVSAVRIGRDAGYMWMDTTPEVAPFGWLGPQLRGRRALVVSPDGPARLLETPAEPVVASETRLEVDAKLDASGRWSARQRETYRGDFEVTARAGLRLLPRAQWKSHVERMLRQERQGRQTLAERVEVEASEPAATREPFVIRLSYELPGLVDFSQRLPALHLPNAGAPLPSSEDLVVLEDGRRLLQGPFTTVNTTRVELPLGWTAEPSDPLSAAEEFGAYSAQYSFADRTLVVERRLTVKQRSLPTDRLAAYDNWRTRIGADALKGFILREAAPIVTANTEEAQKHYDAGREANGRREYSKAVESLEKAVQLAADHKDAWAVLGRAYLAQRLTDRAIVALRKQIAIVPGHFEAHRDLARALWDTGKLADAETEYKKALETSPEDAYTRWRLGAVLLAQKKFDAAAPELTWAAARDDKNANIKIDLGEALLAIGQDEEAFAALDAAVMLRPEPLFWNNAAWRLALAGKRLDRAVEWAESAVVTTGARLRSVVPESIAETHLPLTRSLVAYWDTLGWVHFRRGNAEAAEPYLQAAFALFPTGEFADHYRQLRARRPAPDPPSPLDVDASRLKQPSDCPAGCSAGFLVALSSAGTVTAVKHSSGVAQLQQLGKQLVGASHKLRFPDAMPTQVVMPVAISCRESGNCSLNFGARTPEGSPPSPQQ
jgi:tetratricopeptide (TPR) repeat protein